MIKPIKWLWKQFNGPQITAISAGISDFLTAKFDARLDALEDIDIDKVNENQAETLGALIGFIRPLISDKLVKYFMFTDGPTQSVEYGTTDGLLHGNDVLGGKFLDLDDVITTTSVQKLESKLYRMLVKYFELNEGRGLKCICGIMDVLYDYFLPKEEKKYTVVWAQDVDTSQSLIRGDIYAYIGSVDTWSLQIGTVAAVVNQLIKSYYAPDINISPMYVAADAKLDRVTWDFQNAQVPALIYEQNTGYVTCPEDSRFKLWVNAASGKFSIRASDVQVNSGTIIHIPVVTGAKITVTNYPGFHNYILSGEEGTSDSMSVNPSSTDVSNGYAVFQAIGQCYLYSIKIEGGASNDWLRLLNAS